MQNIRHLYGRLVPANLNWSFCVKAEVKLAGMLLRVIPLIFGHLSVSLVKVTWGYAKNVRRILRGSGPQGLAKYLKTCHVLMQQVAGGQKLGNPWEIGCKVSRTRRGLPRIINPQHRRLIIQGDIGVIRFWLSLFGLYRVIEFKGALKLKTITEPGKDISRFRMDEWSKWIPLFYTLAQQHTGQDWKMDPSRHLTPWSIPFSRKSAPNSSGLSSLSSLALDILALAADREFSNLVKKWLNLVDGLDFIWALRPLRTLFEKGGQNLITEYREKCLGGDAWRGPVLEAAGISLDPHAVDPDVAAAFYAESMWGKPLHFGKLGFKEEPGKIRVFAMVNPLLQTLMYPLHKWIFDRLRAISTDGTFNQTAPVARLIKGFRKERQFVASYDLSAATDRLPLLLQMDLLEPLLGKEGASMWGRLLVGRPYRLPKIAKSYNLGFMEVIYAVGQPMGALSSWALLALTHHALVQLAAHNVYPRNRSWFLGYAVLGDDVVIADQAVAVEYLRIMAEIGVEVGLAKSMISHTGSLEFAKRTYIRGQDASPISLAELMVALCHLGALDELVRKAATFIPMKVSSVARFAGFGYKNLARLPVSLSLNNRLSKLIAYLSRPGGVWPMPVEAWLSAVGPGREGQSLDTGRWATAQSLWSKLVRAVIQRNARFEHELYQGATVRYTDATHRVQESSTLPGGRERKVWVTKPIFGPTAREVLYLDSNSAEWNTFFTEWVAYPFTNRLRKTFEKIDLVLRVLNPNIQPQWDTLDKVWATVFEADEGQAALPKRIDYFDRETDVVATSTRLVSLWARLRSVLSRGRVTTDALSTYHGDPLAGLSEYERLRRTRRRPGG
jgi:hypothetical protein